MLKPLSAFLAACFFALGPGTALADPADDINQAIRAFAAVQSVHVDVTAPNGMSASEDMVAPNKSHIWFTMMGRPMQWVIIGNDTYVNYGGSWKKSRSTAANPIVTQMNAAQRIILKNKDVREQYRVTGGAPAAVNGTPARKYHLVDKSNGSAVDVYLGPGSLPLQIVFDRGDDGMTWTYTHYNGVAGVNAPM